MLLRLLLVLSLAACGSTESPDAGTSPDANSELDAAMDSTSLDANLLDANLLDGNARDANPGDTNLPDANVPDTPEVDAALPDAGPATYVAVAGARCSPQTRIGMFSLRRSGLGPYMFGTLSDAPRPGVGEPAQTSGPCVFHQANRAPCECMGDDVCTHDRESCVPAPTQVDIGVVVHAGAESFTTTPADEGRGPVVSERVPLTGDSFGLTVTGLGATIIVEPTTIPPRFAVDSELTGSYDAPEAMDLSWEPAGADTHVYSLTNINHHVPEITFTECVAPASESSIRIPGSMLVPLSVSTGLEFQQVEVIRFAAAELPEGCVEFRFAEQ